MVALMAIYGAYSENVHAYFYVSSNAWKEIRLFVKASRFPDNLLQRLHRLKMKHQMKPGSFCMVDVDHIRMDRFLEIERECRQKNITLLTHGYSDSTPKHDVAKMIRERGEKILKGEVQADDTFVFLPDASGKPTTGTNKVRR